MVPLPLTTGTLKTTPNTATRTSRTQTLNARPTLLLRSLPGSTDKPECVFPATVAHSPRRRRMYRQVPYLIVPRSSEVREWSIRGRELTAFSTPVRQRSGRLVLFGRGLRMVHLCPKRDFRQAWGKGDRLHHQSSFPSHSLDISSLC